MTDLAPPKVADLKGFSALEAVEISKNYPGTLALDRVSIRIRPGMVSALIGENGAGKSTLVKILAGVERPTSGVLLLNGVPITMASVRDADRYGIGLIHQELNLCPNMSVAENIFLGREAVSCGLIKRKLQENRARELLNLLEEDIDPAASVASLPLGQQQIVEIAKALERDVRVLMMDEPTSALSQKEVRALFRIIRDLTSQGVAIVYISHRLPELLEISDEISVLRDGRLVGRATSREVNVDWIVKRMTGREARPVLHEVRAVINKVALRVDSVSLASEGGRALLDNVSCSVSAGEVVGIYGLMGAGRTELLECIIGLRPDHEGAIWLDTQRLNRLTVAERIGAGIAMVPEDRQTSGLVQPLSVRNNITLSSLGKVARTFYLSPKRERQYAEGLSNDLRIKTPSLDRNVAYLSGGNQQKVIIAKCLLTSPRVLLLDEPTRGVDVGAKSEIYEVIRRLAASGIAIVLVSSELEEIHSVADRVVVMSRGRVSGEFSQPLISDAALATAASLYLEAGQEQ